MKKILLSLLSVASLGVMGQTTIEKSDLRWTPGTAWYMDVTPGKSIGDFDASGTSASWDFTSYEGAAGKDTMRAISATGGTGSVVAIKSQFFPETNYSETSGSYAVVAVKYGSTHLPTDAPMDLSFPHSYGMSPWATNTKILFTADATLAGQVLAEGTITTSWGNFNALLVQEDYNISGTPATYYYWETKEYGRIATLIGSNFSLMVDNTFDSPTSSNEVVVAKLNVFPNPATNQFTVSGENLTNVKVYDALGNIVANDFVNGNNHIVNTSSFKAGVYFVQAISNENVVTKSVVIK